MRQGRANGGADGELGGADAAAGPVGALRRQRPSQSHPSSSSSRGGEAAEGGGRKQGRRESKRREEVLRAIRDRLPPPPACWGNVSVVQERRGRRERPGGAVGVEEEGRSGAGTAALPAWCCLCPQGDCSLQPNPSANGKEDPGLRSLIERNDFYSDDCNPHAAAAKDDDDDGSASPAADFD
ncbi:uncharacterized protein LOC123411963 [Hordeum vulgare subsp. vulgare]|uniref:Predicted protein n=1 Tax=Hordeum vulgare subsp. vulgare TaxID=112509 RepID=F2CSA5_HORVV|nr:uncharacterized protein LOC123411963 [Hordeum vulgare subsp. vulgare]BAJ85726.1 predicted protein [Hordeum vulgare subsp. vulgare]BAJ89298.1 predicted protein [Hordeum vulgare subsp. vulgare]BAJ97571.1 predicted protein [Hordeum vulgare subsp. vulgare]